MDILKMNLEVGFEAKNIPMDQGITATRWFLEADYLHEVRNIHKEKWDGWIKWHQCVSEAMDMGINKQKTMFLISSTSISSTDALVL